jgi:hypothetical protein
MVEVKEGRSDSFDAGSQANEDGVIVLVGGFLCNMHPAYDSTVWGSALTLPPHLQQVPHPASFSIFF